MVVTVIDQPALLKTGGSHLKKKKSSVSTQVAATFFCAVLVPSVPKNNLKNIINIKTKKTKTKRVKLPTGGRFAPPWQVPPLLFSFSFSFYIR